MKGFLIICGLFWICTMGWTQQRIAGPVPDDQIVYTCAPCGCAEDDHYFSTMGQCPGCNMPLQPSFARLQRRPTAGSRPTVGILLFNGADIMDVTGPLSVFEHAGFNITTFAQSKEPVRIGRHLELKPDYTIEQLPPMDVLVFPGGGMAESDPGNVTITTFIQNRYDSTKVLFSVCSGAFFLGEAGVLNGQRATTFASLIPRLQQNYPKAEVLNTVKYTDNGRVVTSSGLSSGIDAAFQVVARFYGVGRAQDIANHMEYPWKRAHDYARSQLADNYLLSMQSLLSLFSTDYFYSQGDHNQWEYRYQLTNQLAPTEILDLLAKELEKTSNWTSRERKDQLLQGEVRHPNLGPGFIQLQLKQDAAKKTVLVVTASRQQRK